MSVADTLANFRVDIGCDIFQLTDPMGLRYYNEWRDKVIDAITKVKDNYFFDYITTETIVWQNEYRIPRRWDLVNWVWPWTLNWMQKIKSISWLVNSTDTEMTVLKPTILENLEKDIETYDKTNIPFYCVMDESIFIYPAPKEQTTLKIYGITYPKKLELTDNETLTDKASSVIFYRVQKKFLDSQNRKNEAQIAEASFKSELLELTEAIWWRVQWPIDRDRLNINYLR